MRDIATVTLMNRMKMSKRHMKMEGTMEQSLKVSKAFVWNSRRQHLIFSLRVLTEVHEFNITVYSVVDIYKIEHAV